jgi:cold shock protein
MIASKEAVAEEHADDKRVLPSAGELQVIREELRRLMQLSPRELTARLDIAASTGRFRALIAEVEDDATASAPSRGEAAVARYDSFCETWGKAAAGSKLPAPPDTVPLAEAGMEVFEIMGSIKWFDASKGYGFIVPDNGLADVLLHVTCLRAGGYQTALEGTRVHCEVLRRPRGMQAFRILAMDQRTGQHASQLPQRTHVLIRPESSWELALVKWFSRVRGFGMLTLGEGRPDVFVHMETLRRFGFVELRPGDQVEVRWGRGSKGLMAAQLRPTQGPSHATH